MRRSTILLPLMAAMVMAACTRGTLLHHYEPVGDEGWDRTDTLCYELPDTPHDGDYRVDVGLRYTNLFPYQGLWIVAETQLHHPTAHCRDTLYFPTVGTDGTPTGKGLNLLQADTLLTTLHLHQGQKGTIRLRHIMTREVLPGIRDVGLKVTTHLIMYKTVAGGIHAQEDEQQ